MDAVEPPARILKVVQAQPRGFCAGVERAIDIVERALTLYGPPVYVRHEIVHNKRVVDALREKGAVFVEELDEVPDGGVAIFSAHGVSQAVEDEATRRNLPILDATCPLVSKVHKEAEKLFKKDCAKIKKKSSGSSIFGKKKVKVQEILIFSKQFATMVKAGLPILQVLIMLRDQLDHMFENAFNCRYHGE